MGSWRNDDDHILNLDDNTLAKQILTTQINEDLPGLKREIEEFVLELGLPNCLTNRIQKNSWKHLVKQAVNKANEKELRMKMESYKKVDKEVLQDEKFGLKPYITNLSLDKARTLFKHKYAMTEHVKMNYKGNPSYARTLWKCNHCSN